MLETVYRNGIEMLESPSLEMETGVRVAFTCRSGGVSGGPFRGLNLSYNVGDIRDDVTSNRGLLAKSLGVAREKWVFGRQVHGACVSVIEPVDVGRGASDHMSGIPRSDGLVTRMPGVALGVLTADCTPVVMVSRDGRAAGVAHVGWRGVVAGTVAATLEKLIGIANCEAGGVTVLIGPYLKPCCMEVGSDVAGSVKDCSGEGVVTRRRGVITMDMGAACRYQLENAGVSRNNIFDSGICTRCDDRYFSYRGSRGTTGRQSAMVSLRSETD